MVSEQSPTEPTEKSDGEDADGTEAYGVPAVEVRGQVVLHPAKDDILELGFALQADGYLQCVDLCAVDYLTNPQRQGLPAGINPQRFEVVASFISHGSQGASLEAASDSDGSQAPAANATQSAEPAEPAGSAQPRLPRRLRVRIQVPEDDPKLPSLCDVYPGTEYLEREIYDMFGIVFENHPDMVRILMPDDWDGHPLRRDYAVGQVPVQFKGAPS